MKTTASIVIQHPIAAVFAFITDVEAMPRWMAGVASACSHPVEMGVGARYTLAYSGEWLFHVDVLIEVTEYEPPRLFSTWAARGPFSFEGSMELREVGQTTEVTNIVEAGPDSLATRFLLSLLGPVLRRAWTRRLVRELEQLRAVMDS